MLPSLIHFFPVSLMHQSMLSCRGFDLASFVLFKCLTPGMLSLFKISPLTVKVRCPRTTGPKDQKALSQADFLCQIPGLCPPPPCCLTLKKSVVPFVYKYLLFKCKVVNTSRKHCFGMDEVGITIDFPSVYVCCPVVSSLSLFLALFLAALQWDSPHMLSSTF